jgi:TatD DNase family protein
MLATKKGKHLVKEIPKERMLTETDGPFTSLNQKTLMRWDVQKAILELLELWQISPEETNFSLT